MTRRILMVDDEPMVLDGMRRLLRPYREQWETEFASGADEAMERLRRAEFDAVVSDVQMPVRDGFDLLESIRSDERTRDIPVIILTGLKDVGLKRRALESGAADLLSKPVSAEDLVARIRSVLRLKACQDELKNANSLLEEKVKERTAELAGSRLEIIWRLAKAAEYRDRETGNHVVRVGNYCRVLGAAMDLDREFVDTLFLASPLHDIGKIGIPDHILLKPGRLDAQEWEVMKQHCAIGADILSEEPRLFGPFMACRDLQMQLSSVTGNSPILEMAASVALTHHERWDGSGYPRGLSGRDIPLESRIVAFADAYDALRSQRPYKPAFSEEEARKIIRSEVNRHFDPAVYHAFERSADEFADIRRELTDDVCSPVEAGL